MTKKTLYIKIEKRLAITAVKQMTNKLILTLLTILPTLALLYFVSPVQAAVRCETQYGGGQVCVRTGNLQVNKQVKNPQDGSWLDNLGQQSSKRFSLNEEVEYRLQVKNVGDAKLDKVTVTDTLPGNLQLVSGNLAQELQNLEVNQTQEVFIKAKVISVSDTINCNTVNVAEVRSGDQYDKDTAQICLEGKTGAPQALPKSGPEDNFVILGLSTLAISTGIYLLKSKAKIYA